MAEGVRSGEFLEHHGAYYPNRPFREQVLEEFKSLAGETAAVITRNLYGCKVLNTARVMFVDIDFDDAPKSNPATGQRLGGAGFFARLFGKKASSPAPPSQPLGPESIALQKVEIWTQANPAWGWRVYRTRAGLRLLATQAPVEADSPIAIQIFEAFDADPLYRQLCKTQKCYRARLTPKPWRCGFYRAHTRWPFLTPAREQQFSDWSAKYEAAAAGYATCEFVRTIGAQTIHPEVQRILNVHDTATRADSKLQLA